MTSITMIITTFNPVSLFLELLDTKISFVVLFFIVNVFFVGFSVVLLEDVFGTLLEGNMGTGLFTTHFVWLAFI